MRRVSVIIPVYNSAHTLAVAIDSVLAQTHPCFELIVVDDGSTDAVLDAVQPYREKIIFLQQVNSGVAVARNTGLGRVSGEFIAWLDADDVWLPEKLAEQMPLFYRPEVGIVYSDFRTVFADGTTRSSFLQKYSSPPRGHVFSQYVQSRFFLPSTLVARAQVLLEAGRFDSALLASEDLELFARVSLHCEVDVINKALVVRYEHGENLSSHKERTGEQTIRALELIMEREPGLTATERSACDAELARQYRWQGYAAFHRGALKEARPSLRKAIQHDWRNLKPCLPLLAASFLPKSTIVWLKRIYSTSARGEK